MTVVSVVVPSRDDGVFLRRCLRDLAAQTRPADEIVVVDNASGDDTAHIARAAGARVVDQPEVGIWPAVSAGYDAATGDLILRLDADSRPPADWVARAVAAFEATPELDLLVGHGDFYGPNRAINWIGTNLYIGGMFWALTPYLGHAPIFGSNFAMRREAWLEMREGAHRDHVGIHDDMDLSYRIRPWMQIRYDAQWRVGISARPFASIRSVARRVGWVGTTVAVNWPDSSPFRHRRERRRWERLPAITPALSRRRRGRAAEVTAIEPDQVAGEAEA